MAVTQIPSSYNFEISYTDDPQALKVIITDSQDDVIFDDDTLETNTVYTITIPSPDTYNIDYYLDLGGGFEIVDSESIIVPEYQIDINWNWDPGHDYNEFISGNSYEFHPTSLILNNNSCPIPPLYPPQITFTQYELIDEVWEQVDTLTQDLSTWDDGDPDENLITFSFTFGDHPTKIIAQVSNCNEILPAYDTSTDNLFLPDNLTNVHSEVQSKGSYTITFNYTYNNEDGDHPSLIITPENSSYTKCDLFLYKNDVLIHSLENLSPTQFYPYTFAEASRVNPNGITYKVRYISTNTNTQESFTQDINFTVVEYKPTFNLPTIECKKVNENTTIQLSSLRFNCFANEEYLHFVPGDFIPNIKFKLYYLNQNNYTWELQNGFEINTPDLVTDVEDYLDTNPSHNDTQVSTFLQNKYIFGTSETALWTPDKLTMVKLVVEVSNYSAKVVKETIFPTCGTWKIRRMSCGSYRIYNYTQNSISFSVKKLEGQVFNLKQTINVAPLSFTAFNLPEDGTYEVFGENLSKYIFNFCSIEGCILELQKKVLLDDTLCNACKLDKVLYQKALRLIPIYETWKKLLDRDWVYEIQYQSTDIDKNLSAIYDADELYLELKNLCDECTDLPKNCSCK